MSIQNKEIQDLTADEIKEKAVGLRNNTRFGYMVQSSLLLALVVVLTTMLM